MDQPDRRDLEIRALHERLSRLSQASLRINESLEFDQVLQGVLDSARSLTGARFGVMTLLDGQGGVQDFLSSGLTEEESGPALADAGGVAAIPGPDQCHRTRANPRPGEARPCSGFHRVRHPRARGGLHLHGGAHVPPGHQGG